MTYLTLVNDTLLRLNEVQLTTSTFSTATGFQAHIKTAVNNAINDINQSEFEWPFNHAKHTEVLTVNINEYALPASFKTVDWESFFVETDIALDVQGRPLTRVGYHEYRNRYKSRDEGDPLFTAVPEFVFRTQDGKMGVSPVPDKAYTVTYEYWTTPVQLSAHSDTTNIPVEFEYVIVDGAMYYGYMFRENFESAQLALNKFKAGLGNMRTLLINQYNSIYDGRAFPWRQNQGGYAR